jgi:hypothetical protein
MTKNSHISGVGGWLGLLIIGLMILGPILGFGRLYGEFRSVDDQFPQFARSPQWQDYKNLSWFIFLVCGAISFISGYRLWKNHVPQSVHFAIVALWVVGPLGNVASMLVARGLFGHHAANALSEIASGLISSCLVAAIWTAYLLRSMRVRSTYGTGM